METLATAFPKQAQKALSLSRVSTLISSENVFQEGNADILPILDEMVSLHMLPGSGADGMENLEELLAKAESGKSCLLLLEHYSNFDLSILSLLVRMAGGRGEDIAKSLVAIAGMKLNEDNPAVAAFASAYTRIVIYPSRSLHGMEPQKKKIELTRCIGINRAAMKALDYHKARGKLIVVFPSGTRYRPWDPSTKKGVREIDSYIRSFDYMCCIALNGMILHVDPADMMNDEVTDDVLRISAGPVCSCAEFRSRALASAADSNPEDRKQVVVDAIMTELERLHIIAEEKRKVLMHQEENHD